ncbi:N-acetylmuramoyl-L-alanine amidase, partial [Floricoccus tropicus]|uniref:N-acetylmuramoyl-L-alanine amidase n=1 Tax=Floricoccus tropicus TaxID=1859473 RepID=UPI001E4F7E66
MKNKNKISLIVFILSMASIFFSSEVSAASAVNDYILKNKIKPASESVKLQINMQDSKKNGGFSMEFDSGKPSLVIIHEVATEGSTVDNEITYMVRNQENAFVHSFVDANSIKTIANTRLKAWGSGPFGNKYGIQIEQTRVTSKEQFARQITNLASWTADQLIAYNLGEPKVVSESNKKLDGNLASHRNISYKWGGTDHVDPDWYWSNRGNRFFAQGYDMYQFRDLVANYYKQKVNTDLRGAKYKIGNTVQIKTSASYESNGSDLKAYRTWVGTISAVRADNKSKSNYSYTVTYKNGQNTVQSVYVLEQDLQQPIALKYKVGDTVQIRANASYESNGSDLKAYRNWVGTVKSVRTDN